MFLEGEVVILNENVKNGLPLRIGERATIVENLHNSPNYSYKVEFDDGLISPIKESELNKLTTEDVGWMTYIFTGNKVMYGNETAKILKVDYIYKQAEILFKTEESFVASFSNLKPIEMEIDIVSEFKFNVGDKVKAHTKDIFNGREGEVEKAYLAGKAKAYDVKFGNEGASFDEDELQSVEDLPFSDIDEIWNDKSRTERHREVIEEIHDTFIVKNADYGNSFGEQYEEYGLLSALIRLDDKMRRLKQLTKQEAQVKDESIRDTVLDLANYAIMTVMELDNK